MSLRDYPLLNVACYDTRIVSQNPCYFFAGGGTGGHLTPGVAVAKELRAREPNAEVVFVGAGRVIEQRLVAEPGFEQRALPVESSRVLWRNPLKFLWRNWKAYRAAGRMLDQNQPRAVIGLGGFASVPLVLAATRGKIPTLLLEQNVIPGRATRWLSRYANVTCVSFEETRQYLPRAAWIEVTGNPVRAEIVSLAESESDVQRRATVLILGGSQGASAINNAMIEVVKHNSGKLKDCRLVHQTGADQCELVRRAYAETSVQHVVEPFFDDMAALYRDATFVISRAGATTLAELACAGCPAVLIPYPHAADNHQWRNARAYESVGAAVVVSQDGPQETAARLSVEIQALLKDSARLDAMRSAMCNLARPQAAQGVAEILYAVLSTKY